MLVKLQAEIDDYEVLMWSVVLGVFITWGTRDV
jgi:hypothetical protein